jgi:hypothetical protein
MGRRSHKREPTLIETEPEFGIIYNQLRKDARVWNSQGQYWLAQECNRRANALLRGDIVEYKVVKHSHELFM